MRVIKEISYPEFRISIFSWNNRYIIKLEHGFLEQTFKIDQFEVSEEELLKLIDADFVRESSERFFNMGESLQRTLTRNST